MYDFLIDKDSHKKLRNSKCGKWISRLNPATKQMYSTQAFCKDWLNCGQCNKKKVEEFGLIADSANYISVVTGKERKNLVRRLGGADFYRSVPQGDDVYFVFHNDASEEWNINCNEALEIDRDNFLGDMVYKWVKSSGRMSGNLGKKPEKEEQKREGEKVSVRAPAYYKPDKEGAWSKIISAAYSITHNLLPDEDNLQDCINILHRTIMTQARKNGYEISLARWETRNIFVEDIDWTVGRSSYKRNNKTNSDQSRLYNDQSQGAVHKPMGKGSNTSA